MGNMMMEQDPVYQTHEKFYDMSSQDGTQVMVLENVPEYGIEQQVRANMGSHWKVRCAKVDPRHFGMGTARPRHYGIAWDSRKVTWNPDMTLESILTSLYARPMMNALSYFTLWTVAIGWLPQASSWGLGYHVRDEQCQAAHLHAADPLRAFHDKAESWSCPSPPSASSGLGC